MKDDTKNHIVTSKKKVISCNNVVIATGYPFYEDKGLFFTRLEALRSYLLAFPTTDSFDENIMMRNEASIVHVTVRASTMMAK